MASPIVQEVDFLISYGYRHILKSDVISTFSARAINLHISFLPWNRGADPNLWSFLEDTPKGISIHQIDSGIDTGEILLRKKIPYAQDDTLKTSYDRLSDEIVTMFLKNWPDLRASRLRGQAQSPTDGNSHRSNDKLQYAHLLTKGWDTPVANLIGKALTKRVV